MLQKYELILLPQNKYNKVYCNLLYLYYYYKYELKENSAILYEMITKMWFNNNKINILNLY